ncbi:MAG TPA: sigma-54 dependent transcriptional regulator [Rhodocyclaceae bacterium]|nr:sigma-54 dependent transcriptional regulator [Rhodocyclaceae bacterium]
MRNVLALDLQGGQVDQFQELASAGFVIHRVGTVSAARKILLAEHCSVGLVVFDEAPLRIRAEVERLIASAPTTEWIAVVSPQSVESADLTAFLLEEFHDYHTLPIDPRRLTIAIGHACGKARLRRALIKERPHAGQFGIVGTSPVMSAFFRQMEKVFDEDVPILIGGESGTGKELVARSIHQNSRRSSAAFVAVNCGAIPGSLIQSELFGHEKGAFTGAAQQKIGSVEAADGGILFLDEIGDLPLSLQANLLRVLQERTVTRLGSTRSVAVDFRLIAASHVDLQQAVRAGTFRQDLYYRLNVIQLQLPPLRDRHGDARLLAERALQHILSVKPRRRVAGFSTEALRAISAYHWPGNVRELINRVHRAAIMSDGRLISADDLGLGNMVLQRPSVTLEVGRASYERELIEASLRANGNNITKAAQQLDISRVTLYRTMSKLNIALGPSGRGSALLAAE